MLDEEEYGSDSSDDDYVPNEGDGSEEENSGEEEDLDALRAEAGEDAGDAGTKRKKRSKKKDSNSGFVRKRQGGIKLDDGDAEEAKEVEKEELERKKELEEAMRKEEELKKEQEEKKKSDDLWASFMADVKPKPKPKPATSSGLGALSSVVKSAKSSSTPIKPVAVVSSPAPSTATESSAASSNDKVTITKVYDFAGETVKITKEVDANSKEAKAAEKQEEKKTDAPPIIPGLKRPVGGLGGVLDKINKKQKMSTLTKSKLDWDSFKNENKIEEELATHNRGRDGYLERKAFLERTDLRQFEIEKNLRLSQSGKR